MHYIAQENHPQRLEELKTKMQEFRASFDNISDDDARKFANEIVTYFENNTAPLDEAARKDVLRYLDKNRGSLITLGSSMMFMGGLSFGTALADKLWAGDIGYLLPTVGGWLFPAQQIFAVSTDGSVQKFLQQVMQCMGRQAAGAHMPAFASPTLKTLSEKANQLGQYVVQHREQIISEWILVADTLVTAGWGHLAINGDPYAMASFFPGLLACTFHAVTVGQNYHRNYTQEGKTEPKALGLPNQKIASVVARQVHKVPEWLQSWMPGLSLATTQLMLAPSLMRGIEQGNMIEALGISSIMAGLCSLYGGFMAPPVRQTLSKEDAEQFRTQWHAMLQGFVGQLEQNGEDIKDPIHMKPHAEKWSEASDALHFLKPIDRAAIRDDIKDMFSQSQEQRSWKERMGGAGVDRSSMRRAQ